MTVFDSGADCSQSKGTKNIVFYLVRLRIVDCGLRITELGFFPIAEYRLGIQTESFCSVNPQSAIRNPQLLH